MPSQYLQHKPVTVHNTVSSKLFGLKLSAELACYLRLCSCTQVYCKMAVAEASYQSLDFALNTLSREDLAAFRPPEYKYPFKISRNPLYLGEETLEWFRNWLIETEADKVLGPQVFERFLKANLAIFNQCVHPVTALGEWGFQWITKFLGYLVIIDDIAVAPDMQKDLKQLLSVFLDPNLMMLWSFPDDPQLLEYTRIFVEMGTSSGQEYEEKMTEIGDLLTEARSNGGKAYPREIVTAAKSFSELWTDAANRSAPESMLLVGRAMQDYMLGIFQEGDMRKKEISATDLQEFIDIRTKSGAVLPILASREIASGFKTPISYFLCEPMLRAVAATNDLVSWDNDIFSFAKELVLEKNLAGNVLAAVSKCKSVNFGTAVVILQKMMDDRMVDLEIALADLKKVTPLELMPNYHIYVDAMHDMLVGCHIWYSETPRYSDLN